jgi:hypothetical protein
LVEVGPSSTLLESGYGLTIHAEELCDRGLRQAQSPPGIAKPLTETVWLVVRARQVAAFYRTQSGPSIFCNVMIT